MIQRIITLCLLACGLWSCSTETGDASCRLPPLCPCDVSQGRIALVGTVIEVNPNGILIEVSQRLSPEGNEQLPQPGEVVGGTFTIDSPCDSRDFVPTLGDVVLALYDRGDGDMYPDCVEYTTCSVGECGPVPNSEPSGEERVTWDECDEHCIANTIEACGMHRDEALRSGQLDVFPWADEIVFSTDPPISLKPTELDVIFDPMACEMAFVREEASCDDN